MKSRSIPLLLASSVACLSIHSAAATDGTWTGSGSTTNWTDTGNWLDGVEAGDWGAVTFDGNTVNGTVNINYDHGIASITLASTLTHDINLNGPNPVIMNSGPGSITIAAGSQNLSINPGYYSQGPVTWDVGAGRTLTFNGGLSDWNGTASLVKQGDGTAVLNYISIYTGATTINGGTLTLAVGDGSNSALEGAGAVTINNGGTLNSAVTWGMGAWWGNNLGPITVNQGGTLTAGSVANIIAHGLTLNGGVVTATGGGNGDWGAYTLKSDVTVGNNTTSTISAELGLMNTHTFTVDGGSRLNISGQMHNQAWGPGGLAKSGVGTLNLSAANTYTGNTTINGGTLQLGTANAVPSGSNYGDGDVTVNDTLDLNTYSDTINGLNGSGTVDTVAGGTPTLTLGANNDSGNFSGVIRNTSGTLALTKAGIGTQTLLGANSYTGVTTISGGTLQLGPVGATNSVTIPNSGFETPSVGGYTYGATGGGWSFSGAGIDNNDNVFHTTSCPEGGQCAFVQGGGSFSQSISVDTPGFYVISFQAEGRGGAGPDGIIVQVDGVSVGTWPGEAISASAWGTYYVGVSITAGSHTLAFVGNNTIGGDRSSSIDDVQMYQPTGYGTLASATDVNAAGATLDLLGSSQTIPSLTGVSGSSVLDNGSLTVGGDNANTTFAGVISGVGSLTKTGSGTLTLSAVNSYTGNTSVTQGVLSISNAFLNDSSSVSIATDAALDMNFSGDDTVASVALGGTTYTTPGRYNATTYPLFFTGGGSLVIPGGNDYDSWGAPYGITSGSEGSDNDHDGLTNFQEYAFGLIPNSGSSVNPITVALDKTAGTFSYTRRNQSLTGLSYTVWYSTNLSTWTQDSGAGQSVTGTSGAVETVQVTITNALLTNPKLFIQVRAN